MVTVNDNIVEIPNKTIDRKHRRMSYEIEFDKSSNTWKWYVVHRVPTLFSGETSSMDKAIAMAMDRIDKIQEGK
jgi:hypothetical protein